MPTEPPPIPPPLPPQEPDDAQAQANRNKTIWTSIWGVILLLAAKAKAILGLAKGGLVALKLGKVLTTSTTMLASIWLYSVLFGWKFAVGFVLLIFVHEMGHVFVAWRQGLPVSAPIFIPGMGALILSKTMGKSAWDAACMGYGGPLAGTLGSLACWGIYGMTGNPLYLGLAYVGFLMNLFNLTPAFPLDGGWITMAISPILWVLGLLVLVVLFVTGSVHNPMIILLVLMSAPQAYQGIRYGAASLGVDPATPRQRAMMGVAYLGLVGFLTWAMALTHAQRPDFERPPRPHAPVAKAGAPVNGVSQLSRASSHKAEGAPLKERCACLAWSLNQRCSIGVKGTAFGPS